ncbi:Imidazoleglycerol-phosphate dehydratase [Candidatus Calditenuaceae archaeon HR02]|nr:Imidazoleglycerol-phosphate dehydratase [Candidatus Calditenuaceae archaeon HR02]
MERRESSVTRKTGETRVDVRLVLEGEGRFSGSTGIKFFDHILTLLAYHSLMDLSVEAGWDLKHHGVEDIGITLGQALGEALGDRSGIARFGYAIIPMDEALAEASVDLVKRPHAKVDIGLLNASIEDMVAEDIIHFFQSLAHSIPAVIHINVRYGLNEHHKVEAAVKALAIALRNAWQREQRRRGAPSSKGVI